MLGNALLLALREIRRNLMRSALTMLGIVIGVASVIVMVNLGSGATAQVGEQIASLGSNLLMVRTGQRLGFGQRSEAESFDIDDAEAIVREVGGIAAVAPGVSEALIATAAGLFAAIPAVIAYNYFLTRIRRAAFHMDSVVVELLALLPAKTKPVASVSPVPVGVKG